MRKCIIVSLIAAVALAIGALPAAAGGNDPTGVKFGVLGGGTDRAILADTAFYIKQGFVIVDGDSTPAEIQKSSINLYVDGVQQRSIIVQEFSATKPPSLVAKWSLFNFPNGLPVGTYALTVEFVFKGQVILTVNRTIYSLATCENGTTNGLLCAPPPA